MKLTAEGLKNTAMREDQVELIKGFLLRHPDVEVTEVEFAPGNRKWWVNGIQQSDPSPTPPS